MGNSTIAVTTTVVVGVVAYLFGFAHCAWRERRGDYITARGKVKPARQAKWASFRVLVKSTLVVVGVLAVLSVWVYRDVADGRRETPLLPAKATPSPTRR